jgi:hypothetical protein
MRQPVFRSSNVYTFTEPAADEASKFNCQTRTTNKADLLSCGQPRTPPDPYLEAALNQLESAVKQE